MAGQIQQFLEREAGDGRLKAERALLAKALDDVQAMAATLTGHLMAAQQDVTELYKVGLNTARFLMAVGDLLIGWLLLRQAAVALARRWTPAPAAPTGPSTRARSRWRRSSPRTCCRC